MLICFFSKEDGRGQSPAFRVDARKEKLSIANFLLSLCPNEHL